MATSKSPKPKAAAPAAKPARGAQKPRPASAAKPAAVKKQSAPPAANVVGGYSYPSGFPYDSVKEVVRIVRENKLAEDKAAFGKHVWVVQGYAMAMLLGDPDSQQRLDFNVIGKKDLAPKDDVVVGILDSLMQSRGQGDLSPQSLGDSGAMVKLSAPAAMSTLLRWSVTKLLELVEQELAAAIL